MAQPENVIDIGMDVEVCPLPKETKKSSKAETKKSSKAEAKNGYSFSSSPEERSKYQALLSNLTVNNNELSAEFKFICELVSLDKNADLAVISVAQVTKLMSLVFTTKWLKNRAIPSRKKHIKDTGINHALIEKYVNERLVRLQEQESSIIITMNETGEKDDTAIKQEEVNKRAFIFNSALRDDFSKWITDTNATEQLSLMGGSISSSSIWLNSLPTKIVNCIRFHYGYTVIRKKRAKANGLLGINFINFMPGMDGMEDPTYLLFSGEVFTPRSEGVML